MASIPWPEDLCNGRVTWWLCYMIADNYEDDDRYPQLKAGAGIKVNFSPDVAQAVRYNGVTGNKTIMPLVSSGVIGDDGYLYTENEDGSAGELGVILPSSECDTLTPRDWTWTVTVTENRIRINRFSISLSPGETIDLADYAPIDSSGGTHIVTETETAERAEKAASQAGQFRQETKTDREATQRLRNEAESFRDEAGSSATSSAQSATTAAEILSDVQDLGITVDTSVGTRVFVGDTMIYGDTGWRDVTTDMRNGWTAGYLRVRRVGDVVYILASGLGGRDATDGSLYNLTNGFRTGDTTNAILGWLQYTSSITNHTPWMVKGGSGGRNLIATRGIDRADLMGALSFPTTDPWPTSLPGTPA